MPQQPSIETSRTMNIIIFSADNPEVECSWDFGNGSRGSGPIVSAEYPFAGTYNVTLWYLIPRKCSKLTTCTNKHK